MRGPPLEGKRCPCISALRGDVYRCEVNQHHPIQSIEGSAIVDSRIEIPIETPLFLT